MDVPTKRQLMAISGNNRHHYNYHFINVGFKLE